MVGPLIKKILWWFIAGCVAVAVLRGIPQDPNGIVHFFTQKAGEVKTWVEQTVGGVDMDSVPKPDSIIPSEAPADGASTGESGGATEGATTKSK